MKTLKEPADFLVNSKSLSKKDEAAISAFIKADKERRLKRQLRSESKKKKNRSADV